MKTSSAISCAAFCLFAGLTQGKAETALSICDADPANLVSNCGFETGDFTAWSLTGNDVPALLGNLYGVEGLDPFDGMSPNSGNFQAYFGDLVSNSTTLSQTFATSPGSLYQVSWYLAQDTAVGAVYSNAFSASFGGMTLLSLTAVPVQSYTHYSYSLIATSSSSVLSLTLGNDLGEFLLDDISVADLGVPEPSAWMLALAGAISLASFARMRRKAG
jgi:flagellin